MPEDITAQILNQTIESIQKLYDLSTRIDERVKTVQINQKELENSIDSIKMKHSDIMQKVAVLESKDVGFISTKFTDCQSEFRKELNELEKRIISVEATSGQNKDRWNRIFDFIIQIIWVILAAWLLMKMGIQAPAVP